MTESMTDSKDIFDATVLHTQQPEQDLKNEMEQDLESISEQRQSSQDELLTPALTIEEAARILGKSPRALERSILGKWGNKLPDGWVAKRITIDGQEEWRVIPPPTFKVRQRSHDESPESRLTSAAADVLAELLPESLQDLLPGLPFNLDKLAQSNRSACKTTVSELGETTIIIDRSDEVERLLREVVTVHKALAEETRQHIEDLRLLAEMNRSVRLLETNASEASKLRSELEEAQRELIGFKKQYQEFLSLPWWKRIFKRSL